MKKSWFLAIILLLGLIAIFFLFFQITSRQQKISLGATFSTVYSWSLDLDPRQVYLSLLDDLKVKKIRIPVYWSEIEPAEKQFDWSLLDFLVDEADKRQAKLTLVIGRKVPRWPECFVPDWAEGLTGSEAEKVLLSMEKAVVERYKNKPAVERWQIENEPFFPFGICPQPSLGLLNKEIELVKSLDSRPVVLTVSGEWDSWLFSAKQSDVLGVSLYRVSWNKIFGFFPLPLKPFIYQVRSWWIDQFVDKIFLSELQAEPWFDKNWKKMTGSERASAFTAENLRDNLEFAKQSGFSEIYFWGVEWWYREKLDNRDDLWQAGKKIFQETNF